MRHLPGDDQQRKSERSRFSEIIRQQFREGMKALTQPKPIPQPSPRRRRTGDTGRAAFRMAATKIMRRAVRLPFAAYAAVSYLADALEWLHHDLAGDIDEDMQPDEYHHLSLHL